MHNPFFESLNGATEHQQKRVENHDEWGGSNFFTNDNKQTNEVFASIGEGGREKTVPRSWNDCASPRLLLLPASSVAITPKFHQNARQKKPTTKQRKTHNKLTYPKLHQCCQAEEEEEKWQQTHNHHPPQNSDKNHRKNKDPHTHTHTNLHHPSPPLAPKKREKKNSHKNTNQIKKKESKKTATTAAAAAAAEESAKRNAGEVGKEGGKQTQKKEGEAPYQQLPVKTVKQA
jgi:hypothetical protein